MSKRKINLLIIFFVLIIAAGVSLFASFITVLSVGSRKSEALHFYSIAGYKKGFVISYTHSVNKGRVHDYYRPTKDKKLELYKTSFVSYGAGIPEPGETPGASFSVTDDHYVINGLNRIVPRLVMAVGLIAEHSITFDEAVEVGKKELYLTDYFQPQTSIIFEYKKVSLISYINHKL